MKNISVRGIRKEFRKQVILEDFSVEMYAGKVYGFSGRNGSGKTVLLKLLTGLMKPSNGEIEIDSKLLGKDIDFPPSVGVIIDKPEFFEEFSGLKNLKILSDIKRIINDDDILNAFKLLGLTDTRKPVRKYSLGMKQRLGLAQAFMESPELVVLDEFTNALDKEGVAFIHEIIMKYKNDNRIIILTSHYENDLTSLCDEIYTVENGRVEKYAG